MLFGTRGGLINLLHDVCGNSKLRLRAKLTFGSSPSYYNVQVTDVILLLTIVMLSDFIVCDQRLISLTISCL